MLSWKPLYKTSAWRQVALPTAVHPLQVTTCQESLFNWKDLMVWWVHLVYVLVKMESGELTCVGVQAAGDTEHVVVLVYEQQVILSVYLCWCTSSR